MAKQNNNKTEVKEVEVKEFVNPFVSGVSYNDFIEALGNKTIKEYCGDHLGIEEIAWLEIEIENVKNNK